jgi:protein-L-isoaspartate O-methyltransferase
MFFDDHPRFQETSHTRSDITRLNLRHEAIITENLDVIEGARVLDLASHDGRWTFAAVKAGAEHVIGVEAREQLVTTATQTFDDAGIDPARYQLVAGDMFRVLAEEQFEVDVVMCLGFLYHTLRYNELFHQIASTGARHLIIDSTVSTRTKPIIELKHDKSTHESAAAVDDFTHGLHVLVGLPSVTAIEYLAASYGFTEFRRVDWAGLLAAHGKLGENRSVRDYKEGKRVTLLAEREAKPPPQIAFRGAAGPGPSARRGRTSQSPSKRPPGGVYGF